ncbi:cupin domain-containing protein [Variovorax sp. M-6]|uniref:cupin domain-containing protein n=1 Tax=Variovorax sp. M-6 TaxID=3233041 RepID=UPI003F9B8759
MQLNEDLFSMIIDPVRLAGVFVSSWRAAGEWAFKGPPESCALFHYVAQGSIAIDIGPGNSSLLHQGDLALFPHGTAHRIGSSTTAAATSLEELLPNRRTGQFIRIEIPGEDQTSELLCAGLHYDDQSAAPLYQLLPESLVIRNYQIEGEPLLHGAIQGLLREVERVSEDKSFALHRGLELIYVLGLRAALEVSSLKTPSPCAPVDQRIVNALLYIHTKYMERSTVAQIASAAGMSRSAFSLSFRQAMGCSPARYLSKLRVSKAQTLLTTTSLTREEIAHRVGFESAVGLYLALRSASREHVSHAKSPSRTIHSERKTMLN